MMYEIMLVILLLGAGQMIWNVCFAHVLEKKLNEILKKIERK